MIFANPTGHGGTMAEFRTAQYALNGGGSKGNVGLANGSVVRDEINMQHAMYLHARHNDENEASTSSGRLEPGSHRGHSSDQSNSDIVDSALYRPSSSSYGISSNHSFKRPENPHNSRMKKQPRTQLAVSPGRPELPPRDNGQPKLAQNTQQSVPNEQFQNFSPTGMRERRNNYMGNSKQTMSQPSYVNSSVNESPSHNGYGQHFPTETMEMNGSMEKISRV